ncbi:MAG TPA: hypothetical protein VK619_17670 [Pyrinomonadaceae bacterium]|nr:hypothetical protein [Pyrinomonadaceae bacterium]
MTSRIILLILVLLFVPYQASLPSFAQSNNQTARKFDEFGDIAYSDMIARLDGFAQEIGNGQNTRGFIIVYRSRRDIPGLSSRKAVWMKHYLVDSRGINESSVVAIDGGAASCLTQELWIVPIGATPTPRSDAYNNNFVDTEAASKFDEFYLPSPSERSQDYSQISYGDEADFLEAYVTALRRVPHSRAYIIAYAQYYIEHGSIANGVGERETRYRRVHLDSPGAAQRILRTQKNHLVRIYHIAPSRITTVNGGYQTFRAVELWIVPGGAHAPIATPNTFPPGNANRR